MDEEKLREIEESYKCFGQFDGSPICYHECDVRYLCKGRVSSNSLSTQISVQSSSTKSTTRRYFKKTHPETAPPLYDYDKFIEKECRKAVNRTWKRASEKTFGEEIDPDTIDPDSNPELWEYYEKIKKRFETNKKREISATLLEKAEEIRKEMPNLHKWIKEDPIIRHNLKRSKFLEVIDYTRDRKVEQNRRWSKKWMKTLNLDEYLYITKEGKEIECNYLVVRIKNRPLGKYLGLSERSVRKYLQVLCKANILIDLGKPGRNKPKLYASGFWLPIPDTGFRRVYFLQNKPAWKEILCRLQLRPY